MRIVGVGDNTVDIYGHRRMKFPGGNAVNVAVLAHRYGAEAAYLGWLGKDERGSLVLNSLKEEGLDISHCRVMEGMASSYSTVTVINGDRIFGESNPGASQHLHLTDEDLDYIATFDLVHTSVYSHLEKQITALKSASHLLAFDLSQRYERSYLERILPHVDIAFLSLASIADIEQDRLMRAMIELGPKLVVVTRGKEGSWVFDGKFLYHQGIIAVEAVDSLGAGDAFAARFLVEYHSGTPVPAAMERAAHSAAENCSHFGAFGHGQPC